MEFIPAEKAQTIRQSSTANLMIDSTDQQILGNADFNPWNFQIRKNAALLNGFFTRVATTEVVLSWEEPNIEADVNDEFTIEVTSTSTEYTVTIPFGFYTVAEALDALVVALNAAGTGLTWSISGSGATTGLAATAAFTVPATTLLAIQLRLVDPTSSTKSFIVGAPDLRPYRYIDFVSADLTYNQDVKDASTSETQPQVLCRWYFAWDDPPFFDTYGFPILMGYTAFSARRIFNPPKQIKWRPNQSIGNLSFRILSPGGDVVTYDGTTFSNWQMTLQVSEV
jgi:hypothetical protein